MFPHPNMYMFRRPCENVAEALVINLDPEWILDLCKYTVFFWARFKTSTKLILKSIQLELKTILMYMYLTVQLNLHETDLVYFGT